MPRRIICTLVSAGLLLAGALPATESAKSTLLEAVRNSDHAAIKTLLQNKADVNAAAPDGATPLLWASYRNDVETAGLLIRAGANVNAATDLGVTPLWPASENGSPEMVRLLLQAGANPNAALLAGETPLMVAARTGNPNVVEQLLARGAPVNARGARNQTALMWAAAQSHPAAVKVLLAHHADLNLRSDTWTQVMAIPPHGHLPYNKAIPHGGETALMFAARVGDLESAKLLVAAGASVNDADAWGVSAVTLAAHSDFTDLVLFLLDKGADPNRAPNGFTALHEAVMRRNETVVRALLDHHADPNFPVKTWTPTRRSSDDFHFEASLIGATPYWLAARFDEPAIMKMLADHGADPKFIFNVTWVAEQGFAGAERTEKASTVLAALGVGGGNVNSWTPMDKKDRESLTLESIKDALDRGADINAPSHDGSTPLDAAKALHYASVADYLTSKGAKPGTGAINRNRAPRGRDQGNPGAAGREGGAPGGDAATAPKPVKNDSGKSAQ